MFRTSEGSAFKKEITVSKVWESTIFFYGFTNNWDCRRPKVVGRDRMKAKSKIIGKVIIILGFECCFLKEETFCVLNALFDCQLRALSLTVKRFFQLSCALTKFQMLELESQIGYPAYFNRYLYFGFVRPIENKALTLT